MYVDTSHLKRGGKTYVRHLLRESYRENGKVKHRTHANLSHCSPAEIEAIKLALKHKGDLSLLVSREQIQARQGLRLGAVACLLTVARQVGLVKALGRQRQGQLALWQVLARLIDQGSRLSAVRLAESHAACDLLGMEAFCEDHLYGNLAWLAEQQEAIEKRLFRFRYGAAAPRLFLYDVTSSYLEGQCNELAAYGYNRDKKKGKKQLVIGLLTGPEGDPVAVRVFAGNTADPVTVAEQVRTLTGSFGVSEVILVGDRGMLKNPQIDQLPQGFRYISAITKPQIRGLLAQGTIQLDLFEEDVCEVEQEKVRYLLRRNPERAQEIARSRADKLASVQALVEQQNRYLADHRRAKAEAALRRIEAKVQKLNIGSWVQAVQTGRSIELLADEEKKAHLAELDGCYAIKTDLSSQEAPARQVHDRYRDLALVERAFRTFKNGHLELRPTFVRTEASSRGHVLVVMLAYLLERELEKCWRNIEVTVPEGIDELGSLRSVEITIGQVTCHKAPEPDGLIKQLLDSAAVTLPQVLPARKKHVTTRKKLVPQRN